MSEYQYYEFLALDQPLTDKQCAELRSLSTRAEIRALADFLDIDQDLLAVAAEASPGTREEDHGGLADWIASLQAKEKDALLARVLSGEGAAVQALLSRRFRRAGGGERARRRTPDRRRTVEGGR